MSAVFRGGHSVCCLLFILTVSVHLYAGKGWGSLVFPLQQAPGAGTEEQQEFQLPSAFRTRSFRVAEQERWGDTEWKLL